MVIKLNNLKSYEKRLINCVVKDEQRDYMEMSVGNKKIGKDTCIINITPSFLCPSQSLGLCKHPKKCYAKKAERMYPECLPFRYRQMKEFDSLSVKEIAKEIRRIKQKSKKIPLKFVRINESGDFKNQKDVEKIKKLAKELQKDNLTVYGYTARDDLIFKNLPRNLVINGSNKMIDNKFIAVNKEVFDILESHNLKCDGNCIGCDYCKTKGNKLIFVKYH